ncbi:amidophosphoribosyltransferase [Sorochytrium milnesiophthora]
MCGIAGILLADQSQNCSAELCEALGVLQHRGQDAAGLVTCHNKGRLYQCKGNGMVRDVFTEQKLNDLVGYMGVAHARYPTAGTSSISEAQPFYVNSPYGIALSHNGNLINSESLRAFLDTEAHRHINTDSDSELLINILANNLQQTGKVRINEEDIMTAIQKLYDQCSGGYACVALLAGFGMIAFRDPHGIRPCVFGWRDSTTVPGAKDYMVASESVSLDALGYKNFKDLEPGQAVIVTKQGKVTLRNLSQGKVFRPCLFEYVYFARPDSIIDGVSVYKARLAMGDALAKQVVRKFKEDAAGEMDIDVVIPVPDTSRVAALQVGFRLGIPYREGLIKNRYIGRTFIMPGQSLRAKSVRRKLNPMALEFAGKNVLLVDDSIVRGTTSREIISMVREAGAKKVYFASCAPPIRYPNVYGIDMPTATELVAHDRSEAQVAATIGADRVIYQELADLEDAVRKFNPAVIEKFDNCVFTGEYVTGDVTPAYLQHLADLRGQSTAASGKNQAGSTSPRLESFGETMGLHNLLDGK